jgi:hypothetical protein
MLVFVSYLAWPRPGELPVLPSRTPAVSMTTAPLVVAEAASLGVRRAFVPVVNAVSPPAARLLPFGDVEVSTAEAESLFRFVEQIEHGRFTVEMLAQVASSSADPFHDIAFEPIEIEALEPIALLEGVRP